MATSVGLPYKEKIMKESELIDKLKTCDLEAEVWLPNVNELGVPGYCVLDHVMTMSFNEIENDVMHNPGKIAKRLLKKKTDSSQIVYLGSIADFITADLTNPLKLVHFVPIKQQTRNGSDKWIFESR